MTKIKKIILLTGGLGFLITSIVVPIVISNNKKTKNNNQIEKINEIVSKIKNKDIIISSNVSTQNQSEIQSAIKNQLKINNPALSKKDLSKITTDISKLKIGEIVMVKITIENGSKNESLKLYVVKINLLKDSNVTNGDNATIFQDEFKNLWTMGKGKNLQVLKVNPSKNGYLNSWQD